MYISFWQVSNSSCYQESTPSFSSMYTNSSHFLAITCSPFSIIGGFLSSPQFMNRTIIVCNLSDYSLDSVTQQLFIVGLD